MAYIPELQKLQSGQIHVLVKKTVNIHKDLYEEYEDYDGDALAFHRFVRNLWTEIFKTSVSFTGSKVFALTVFAKNW